MEFLWDLFHRIYDVEFLVRTGGLLALIVIVFVETGLLVGFFLPGDSLLVTAGIFAARGDLDLVEYQSKPSGDCGRFRRLRHWREERSQDF